MKTSQYWDTSWNPVKLKQGGYYCDPVSPGCQGCWASKMNVLRFKGVPFGSLAEPEFVLDQSVINRMFNTWRKPRIIAVQWLGDFFHEAMYGDDIAHLYGCMWSRPEHTFLTLTKRVERMSRFFRDEFKYLSEPPNIYHGATICNQAEADEKIPALLKVPGKKWLSVEPLLGPVNLDSLLCTWRKAEKMDVRIGGRHEWKDVSAVVVGCETGPRRRPCKLEWIQSIVDQCKAAGVPVWVKAINVNGRVVTDISQFPQSLRVRETPWK